MREKAADIINLSTSDNRTYQGAQNTHIIHIDIAQSVCEKSMCIIIQLT